MKSYYKLILNLFVLSILGNVQAIGQITIGTSGQVEWSYWRNLGDDLLGELYAKEFYPNSPDGHMILNKIQSPVRFDNDFGSLMRGFIMINTTDSVRFNITGDDQTAFFLSTDDNPNNLLQLANIPNYTEETNHDKYLEQTSMTIQLLGGQYYYFELRSVEGGGNDFVSLWWKNSLSGLDDWNYVSSDYIYDIAGISECPQRGTPCNDGNSATIDDLEDGFCNCLGIPPTENSCIGDRFDLVRYKYLDIPGGSLSDLLLSENYPSIPNTSSKLDFLGTYKENKEDNLGSLVEGYITVPVSGVYHFNITGNSRARMFLSSNDQPEFKSAHQILNINSINPTEHDNDLSQSMIVNLTKGEYYYFEITHKESTSSEHFSVFWKTPYAPTNDWKRIPLFYLYDFDCEMACVNDGTPCDDGDPFTNNDQYTNCECTGTPCIGADCDSPLANYQSYPSCDITDQLDNRSDASWLSCDKTPSPNPNRGTTHWILYDFNNNYRLYQSQVWNYNATGELNNGFTKVIIDYSSDGTNWTQLGGTYTWELSGGAHNYEGFQGPNFNGIGARYVLITSVDVDNTNNCRGIGKILFNAGNCLTEGITCSDNNSLTTGDIIVDCNCIGLKPINNDCDQANLELGISALPSDNYSAINSILSANLIKEYSRTSFVAGNQIELQANFEVIEGAIFIAQILNCGDIAIKKEIEQILKNKKGLYLELTKSQEGWNYIIDFLVPYQSHCKLEIFDNKGNIVRSLMELDLMNPGFFRKNINTRKLQKGNYKMILSTDNETINKNFAIK